MDLRTLRGSRAAFFGGSFDPPHLGHLAVARAAQTALDLDAVLFAPVGAQPLKPEGSTASFVHRLAMTRLAIASEPGFAVSLVDAPKASGAPNYTVETLLRLRAELPPQGALFCLMGADAFAGLKGWHRAAEIPFAAPLIVASRPGQQLRDWKTALPAGLSIEAVQAPVRTGLDVEIRAFLLRNMAGDRTPFYLLPGLEIEISASEIRDQMRNREQARAGAGGGMPGRELLPSAVLDYICAEGLYR
jgi:nicotinate-nucleotide adenylyltransferase